MSQPKSYPRPLTLVLLLSGVFFLCFLVVSGMLFLSSRSQSGRGQAGAKGSTVSSAIFGRSTDAVGVIELTGIILDSKRILAQLDAFDEDEQVKAVVLRLNSPGGVTAPSQEIYEAVKAYKKPLVVSMSSLAASGAYYIAVGAKKIFANSGTLTGSIGVVMEFVNLEKLYEWAKIHRYVIKSGRHKDIGAEFRDITPEEREILQATSDDILEQFKGAVAEGRDLDLDKVTELATGQVFSGRQAKALHLIDELGTLQDAVNEAGKLADIKGKPLVVYAEKRKKSVFDYLLLDDDNGNSSDSRSGDHRVGAHLLGYFLRLINVGNAVGVVSQFTGALRQEHVATDFVASDLPPGVYMLWRGGR